jgi:hypothetical protein
MPTPLPSPTSLIGALLTLENTLTDFERGRGALRFNAASSDGKVTATVDGMLRVVTITIDRTELGLNPTVLATKVKDVVNTAIELADAATRSAITTFAGALGLPGLPAFGAPIPDYLDFAFTAADLEAKGIANNPCESGVIYECRKGPVVAQVNAKRRVVSLAFDVPLPTIAEHLATRAREAINCADDGAADPEDDPIIDVVTGSPSLNDLVLYAKGLLKLNDRVKVKTPGGADWATIVNAGLTETNIGVETEVGNILSRARVFVRDRGRVRGFITTSDVVEKQNQTEIEGPITEHATLVLPDLILNVSYPSNTIGTIELEPNQQRTAGPGYYNKLHAKSGAQVFFTTGVYYLNEFFLEPQSKLWLNQANGPVIIYVKNGFTYRGEILVMGGGFPRLFIGYTGTNLAVVERVFRGTLSAPNAKINIASVTETYEGAFHGKDIEAFPDAKFWHRRFELRYDQLPGTVPPPDPFDPVVDLGFETLAGWTSPQASLSLATTPMTEGQRSLLVGNVTGSTEIISENFSANLAPQGATRFLVDLWIPSNQPNPTFVGSLNAIIMIPSAGINIANLGAIQLTGLPQNQFRTLEFLMPANLRTALDGNFNDVSIRLVLNVNSGSGPWYIDNVRFAPPGAVEPPASVEPILSFEDVSKWSSPQVTLTLVTSPKTHLTKALRFPPVPGWTEAISVPFSTATLAATQGKIRVDVWTSSNQPNQWWHGQFLVRFDIPSLGIVNAQTPAAELTPLSKNTFHTIELNLPQNVKDAINGSHPNIVVKAIVNATPGAGPYYLDNIRFDPPPPPQPPQDVSPILSFEDLSKWTSGQVTLTTVTSPKTHLQRALRIPVVPGWTQAVSVPFSSATISAPTGKIRVDVWPSSNQPNQFWHGQFLVYFDVPSLGIVNAETPLAELTPLTKNQFTTIELAIPQNVRDAINGSHPIISVKPVLNVFPGSGPYYLDNIRFV